MSDVTRRCHGGFARRAGRGLAIVLAAVLLAGGGLEVLCRTGRVENRAHRIAAVKEAAAGAARRVLVVGDSFSLEDAAQGPDTFANLLEPRLAARGAAVLNLSVSGTGPLDYLDLTRLARLYGPPWQPDVVLVNYYVGNDVSDTAHRLRSGESRVPLPPDSGPLSLLSGSHLLRFLQDARRERRIGRLADRLRQRLAGDAVARRAVNPFLADMGRTNPAWLAQNLLLEGDEVEGAWAAIEAAFAEIVREARFSGARTVLNVFPSTPQVDCTHHDFYAGASRSIRASSPRRFPRTVSPPSAVASASSATTCCRCSVPTPGKRSTGISTTT